MPLVAYETSDDEDSQGEDEIKSQVATVVLVPGATCKTINNHSANLSSIGGKLLLNQPPSNVTPPLASTGVDDDDDDEEKEDGDSSLVVKQMVDLEDDDVGSSLDSDKLLGKLPGVGKKLPAPSTSTLTSSLSNIVVVDKKSKRIKVVIPSLDEMDYASEEDEEEVGPKRKITPAGGCSLSSFLPKPKNAPPRYSSTNLFSSPSVSTNSSPSSSSSSSSSSNLIVKSSVASLIPHSVSRPKTKIPPKRPQNVPVKIDEEADSQSTGFFSFGDVTTQQSIQQLENHLESSINKIRPVIIPRPEIELTSNEMREIESGENESTNYYNYPQPQPTQSTSSSKRHHPSTADINDPDFKKYVASRFGEEPADKINIVEVDVGSYLANNTELIKSISMESGPTTGKGPAPSALAKRKNQITYLAFQAQQRELDLKNQASNNRFTKSQTRAKYGF